MASVSRVSGFNPSSPAQLYEEKEGSGGSGRMMEACAKVHVIKFPKIPNILATSWKNGTPSNSGSYLSKLTSGRSTQVSAYS
jgi:hypothetical protein